MNQRLKVLSIFVFKANDYHINKHHKGVKVKRFGKKILLLTLLLIIVMLLLNFLGIQAGNIYKDGAALVCEAKRDMVRSGQVRFQEGKVNVLFMGTSRILAGIQPLLFDRLSGGQTYSYNLALPALTIGSSYFVLRDYLGRNPPPAYIILQLAINRCKNCYTYNYYATQGISSFDELLTIFKNVENKSIILNYIFPFRMYKNFIFKYLYNILLHPASIRQIKTANRKILEKMTADRGFYYIKEQAVDEDERIPRTSPSSTTTPDFPPDYDPFADPFVEKFFDLTREKGIHVILIQPVYRENQYSQYKTMPYQYKSLLERYPHVMVAKNAWKLKFYPINLFADHTHLNPEGAELYTREIFNEFFHLWPGAF